MRRHRGLVPVLALTAGLALAGCTPQAAAPTAWQGVVQNLASEASDGDYASATATLDQLEADVTAQRDAGAITSAEAEAILSRIATVRADLASLAPSPEPVPEFTPAPTQSAVGDDGTVPDEPQNPAEPDDKGSGNSGKGNGGKGKSDSTTTPGGPGKKDG